MYKGNSGASLTQGLFYEFNKPDAPFSMRDTGTEEYYVSGSGKKYRSFPYLFRQYVDEYEFAIAVLGSWEHWNRLKALEWFNTGKILNTQYTGLNHWREEQKRSDESKAKRVLLDKIEEGDLQAAKFLYGDVTKVKAEKGRPEKKKVTPTKASVLSIAKRVGINGS